MIMTKEFLLEEAGFRRSSRKDLKRGDIVVLDSIERTITDTVHYGHQSIVDIKSIKTSQSWDDFAVLEQDTYLVKR
jgi:hypothetical protein